MPLNANSGVSERTRVPPRISSFAKIPKPLPLVSLTSKRWRLSFALGVCCRGLAKI